MLRITVDDVTKSYRDFKAVDGVSLTIAKGESVGLVGESGCGKSTVAGLIAGLTPVDSGAICFDEQDITSLKRRELADYRRRVQMVFQDSTAALNPRRTAGQAIAEPIENFLNLSKQATKERVEALLEQVGLGAADYHKYPRAFSGGQKQRIAIARAIAIDAEFLLLDEVTSNLDVSIQAQILNLLKRLQAEHDIGFLLISHDFGVVRYMCDKILIMYQGRLVETLQDIDLKEVVHPYSQLLLASVPSIHEKMPATDDLVATEAGEGSGSGCLFYDRCPLRKPICHKQVPQLTEVQSGHTVACFARTDQELWEEL